MAQQFISQQPFSNMSIHSSNTIEFVLVDFGESLDCDVGDVIETLKTMKLPQVAAAFAMYSFGVSSIEAGTRILVAPHQIANIEQLLDRVATSYKFYAGTEWHQKIETQEEKDKIEEELRIVDEERNVELAQIAQEAYIATTKNYSAQKV